MDLGAKIMDLNAYIICLYIALRSVRDVPGQQFRSGGARALHWLVGIRRDQRFGHPEKIMANQI
jgi:hypothetical protein